MRSACLRPSLAALVDSRRRVGSASAATPPLGASPDWSKVDGAAPYRNGYAMPLEAASPAGSPTSSQRAWTPRTAPPSPRRTDAPLPGEIGIRPGSWMIAPAGCTMNFVFGSPGSYSIGTAGHCGGPARRSRC